MNGNRTWLLTPSPAESATGNRDSQTGRQGESRSSIRAAVLLVVVRFLALLELFREGAVGFEQVTPLGELTVRWTGSDAGEIEVDDDYDDVEETT